MFQPSSGRFPAAILLALVLLATSVAPAEGGQTPFPSRKRSPSLAGAGEWINVSAPLDIPDLRGKFVLLDFWTYCCINCMHILPELKKLEQAWPNNLVVIGVHSGKFANERDAENIREAVLRYQIEHPVVNDANYVLWHRFGVNAWPTLRLIDPEGNLVGGRAGEVDFSTLDRVIRGALPHYRRKGVLDETPLEFNFARHQAEETPLRFPGKVLADPQGNRLFIADSSHNRIVVSRLDGQLIDVIGTGAAGREDGPFDRAAFDDPQGMALRGEILYVADTRNHLIRKVDLAARQVKTIAGDGRQRRDNRPKARRNMGIPLRTSLASPWALWIHKDDLYIAMAGPHQVWWLSLDERQIGVHAGSGHEDIIDGALLSRARSVASAFAQPSGLSSDGRVLFVADSEGSSIRIVPFDPTGSVRTLVGTANLPAERLFTFGDADGLLAQARLQHPLDVAWYEDRLYVADTYNSKIKVIDPEQRQVSTLCAAAYSPDAPLFDEPAGISPAGGKLYVADTNGHRIRVIDLDDESVSTLTIDGLLAPRLPDADPVALDSAQHVRLPQFDVRPEGNDLVLAVDLRLPPRFELNDLAPMRYRIDAEQGAELIDAAALGRPTRVMPPANQFDIRLPLAASNGELTLKVALTYYYCEHAGGLCKVGSVVWIVPARVRDEGLATIELPHQHKID